LVAIVVEDSRALPLAHRMRWQSGYHAAPEQAKARARAATTTRRFAGDFVAVWSARPLAVETARRR
jgi:hypothetical protein